MLSSVYRIDSKWCIAIMVTFVARLNDLVEERLIGYEEPTKEDAAAIKEYEATKKNGKPTLVPLNELTKGT